MKKETKLKKAIKESGLTQTFVALKIGMPIKRFNDIVNGRVSCKAAIAIKIAEVLNIPIEKIV